jgi:hypothetical protein
MFNRSLDTAEPLMIRATGFACNIPALGWFIFCPTSNSFNRKTIPEHVEHEAFFSDDAASPKILLDDRYGF